MLRNSGSTPPVEHRRHGSPVVGEGRRSAALPKPRPSTTPPASAPAWHASAATAQCAFSIPRPLPRRHLVAPPCLSGSTLMGRRRYWGAPVWHERTHAGPGSRFFRQDANDIPGSAIEKSTAALAHVARLMGCVIEQVLEDGEEAILEWREPLGLRGCGFFQVRDDRLVFQRGDWDKLTFLRSQGLPLPHTGDCRATRGRPSMAACFFFGRPCRIFMPRRTRWLARTRSASGTTAPPWKPRSSTPRPSRTAPSAPSTARQATFPPASRATC